MEGVLVVARNFTGMLKAAPFLAVVSIARKTRDSYQQDAALACRPMYPLRYASRSLPEQPGELRGADGVHAEVDDAARAHVERARQHASAEAVEPVGRMHGAHSSEHVPGSC